MAGRPAPTHDSAGFTLVEALVSLVVLSVGLLGLAQLIGFSLQTGNTSYQQTIARAQTLDMAERMWLDLTDPLAQVDDWKADHQGSLPGWTGDVTPDPSDPNLFLIRVQWSGSTKGTSYTYYLRLPKLSTGGGT